MKKDTTKKVRTEEVTKGKGMADEAAMDEAKKRERLLEKLRELVALGKRKRNS